MMIRRAFVILALAGLGCCIDGEPTTLVAASGIEIAVAPHSLTGLGKVCYDLQITNGPHGTGSVIWARGTPGLSGPVTPDADAICSDQYGSASGGMTYIGPCDADGQEDADLAGERMNSVTLWFDGLYDDALAYVDPSGPRGWHNPCPLPLGCTLNVLCEENADTRARFDFTIVRQANAGFFDIAVRFDDIHCSAKLDTCYAIGTPSEERIELLHGDDDGARDWTAVFGLACTAGAGDYETMLSYGSLAIECGDTTLPLDPIADQGNNHVTVGSRTLHYAIYRGSEDLECDDPSTAVVETCRMLYWNIAISLDDLAGLACGLTFSATATDGDRGFSAGLPDGRGVAYPYIDVNATLTPATCQQNSLGDGGAVSTAYRGDLGGLEPPETMCFQFDGTAAEAIAGALCSE